MGQDLSHVVGQETEELVFIRGQVQFFPVQAGASRRIVNGEPAVGKQGGLDFLQGLHIAQPPLGGAESGQKLIHGKGLGQIVVRPGVQGGYLIVVLASGADDNHGGIGPGTDFENHVHSVHVRKPQVQQDDVRPLGSSGQDTLFSLIRPCIMVIVHLQGSGDEIFHCFVILYNQDGWLIHVRIPPWLVM